MLRRRSFDYIVFDWALFRAFWGCWFRVSFTTGYAVGRILLPFCACSFSLNHKLPDSDFIPLLG